MTARNLTHEVETSVTLRGEDYWASGVVTLIDCHQLAVAHNEEPWDHLEIQSVVEDRFTASPRSKPVDLLPLLSADERHMVATALYEAVCREL
ncbi:hypothetical protein [Brasilonema bromeliae]|uniref:Uncharacterized protein n=1 Tax=Brasilonema bromeliae SPC951 TaxID=385972 RepID=A0ABX1PDI1_9CYAN|nr:hypothetical protein [Brasilonema bromeliae]NMG22525.1 hypothetical protein [Brasilonema bromeliae SPC951]